jgi:hypothetical protein
VEQSDGSCRQQPGVAADNEVLATVTACCLLSGGR